MPPPLPARRRLAAAAFAAALACHLAAAPAVAVPPPGPAVSGFDVQGHRGSPGRLPESSMAGFRRALELGVNTLELDVQITRDRVLVVHHDPALDPRRCQHDDGREVRKTPLEDLDFADLADIDCGSLPSRKFPEQQAVPGARIPRLDEVLELARSADYPVRLSLEIKRQRRARGLPVDEVARRLVAAIDGHGLAARTTVQSFDVEALHAVERLDGSIRRALVTRWPCGHRRRLARAGNPPVLVPRFGGLTAAKVRKLQARGVAVIPWTVNRPAAIRRAISWGVDGLVTDYPGRVIEILRAAGAATDSSR